MIEDQADSAAAEVPVGSGESTTGRAAGLGGMFITTAGAPLREPLGPVLAPEPCVIVVRGGVVLIAGAEGLLQEGVERGSRQAVAGDFQESPGQRLPCRGEQGRVVAPLALLLLDGLQEAFGDASLGAGPDLGLLLSWLESGELVQLLQTPVEALQHLLSFRGHP